MVLREFGIFLNCLILWRCLISYLWDLIQVALSLSPSTYLLQMKSMSFLQEPLSETALPSETIFLPQFFLSEDIPITCSNSNLPTLLCLYLPDLCSSFFSTSIPLPTLLLCLQLPDLTLSSNLLCFLLSLSAMVTLYELRDTKSNSLRLKGLSKSKLNVYPQEQTWETPDNSHCLSSLPSCVSP